MHEACDPVVLGGSGGSGTRLVAELCLLAGYDMGTRLNKSYDALAFARFYTTWVNPYLLREAIPLGPGQLRKMEAQFRRCLVRFRGPMQGASRWGWKNPRAMLMLPFLDASFSALKFVHVVRDGRDMAYSSNQNQPREHGEALLGTDYEGLPKPLFAIAFWSQANRVAARYGEEVMGDRYLRLRYEDLCLDPRAAVERLADFLEVTPTDRPTMMALPRATGSIGRWRDVAPEERAELLRLGRVGLDYFGYPGA